MKFRYWLVSDPTRSPKEVEQQVPAIMRWQLEKQFDAKGEQAYWQVHHPNEIPVAVFGDFDHPDREPIHLVWGLKPDDEEEVKRYKKRFRELDAQVTPNLETIFNGCLAILQNIERLPAGVDRTIEDIGIDANWERQVRLWLARSPKRTLWELACETVRRAYRSALTMSDQERHQRVQVLYRELERRINGD